MIAEAKSDVGQVRKINEDSYLISAGDAAQLYVVADGMGGHKSGEVASALAVKTLESQLQDLLQQAGTSEHWEDALRTAFVKANKEILTLSMENDQHNGMGTTLTAVIVQGRELYIAHIGDSRLYLVSAERIAKVTADHSLVEELLRQGEITQEEAVNHPRKNILLRALGTAMEVEVDFYHTTIVGEEALLLATDGLTNLLLEKELQELVLAFSPKEAVEKMMDLANARGGYDNITVLIAKR